MELSPFASSIHFLLLFIIRFLLSSPNIIPVSLSIDTLLLDRVSIVNGVLLVVKFVILIKSLDILVSSIMGLQDLFTLLLFVTTNLSVGLLILLI